jgi:hypothetical protein
MAGAARTGDGAVSRKKSGKQCKEEKKGQGGWRGRVLALAAHPEGGAYLFQSSIENWVGIIRIWFGCEMRIVGRGWGQQESNLEPPS